MKEHKKPVEGRSPPSENQHSPQQKDPTASSPEGGETGQNRRTHADKPEDTNTKPRSVGAPVQSRLWRFIVEPKHSNALVAIFTILIFVTGAFYAVFAALQWGTMKGQLEQMVSSTRPWVGVEPGAGLQVSQITFDEQGNAKATIAVSAKNYGNSPARNVMAIATLVILQDERPVIHDEIRDSCDRVEDIGAILFPGCSVARQWSSKVTADKFKVGPGVGPPLFIAYVVGCIGYRDTSGSVHHTGFAYRDQVPGKNEAMTFTTRANRLVPPGEWLPWFSSVD
jgi:hypothetical protein